MKLKYCIVCLIALLSSFPVFAQNQPWESPYNGTAATKENTIALWHFNGDGKDASGHSHNATLRGKDTHFISDGKFDGALEIDDKTDPGDTRQGVAIPNAEDLNLKGAFTLEMWISPSAQLANSKYAVLLDKKNIYYASKNPSANTGYLLAISPAKEGKFELQAQLGFGSDTATISSSPQAFEANRWYHIAFIYDGNGLCTFYLGSERIGQTQLKDRAAIAPNALPLVIGDRIGSTGWRFYGKIDEVRIQDIAQGYVSGKVLLDASDSRTAFYRMEKDAAILFNVSNDTLKTMTGAAIEISAPDMASKTVPIPELASGKSTFIFVPIDSSLRPNTYQITAAVKGVDIPESTIIIPLTIVPRQLPHQMPVILWENFPIDYNQLKDIGYTGKLNSGMADYEANWAKGAPTPPPPKHVKEIRQLLDGALATQFDIYDTLQPGRFVPDAYKRKDRDGKILNNTDGLYPKVQQYVYDNGKAVMDAFGDMPSLKGALIIGESRDGTAPSFNDIDKETYRKFSGQDIPPEITAARGVDYHQLPGFPSSRILPDNDRILTYYKWFWKVGDGWNTLHSKLSDGFRAAGRKNFFTWTDPATRVPSTWGSGGDVDMLNQWTYTYPNPLKSDLATNELFAMAAGRPGQKVMNMVQIIWYRNQTTKKPVPGQETAWEKATPDAEFISIAPDHLSEATWLELAYPVSAIANHGWGSLGDHLGFNTGAYVTTNVDTRKRMTELYQNIVKPLAPTLLQVPDYKTDVAFLESFTSQMFAGTGTYGWGGGWGADSYMIARYADLQPQIIYDDTIQKYGLDQYKVLFLTDCPVLSQSVADQIIKFQQRGGIVIGDEDLAPGVQPDILLPKVRQVQPKETKELLQNRAASLRAELDTFYQHPVESSNLDVITRLRQFDNSQYIFAINDLRIYGDYVGQYKMVMEKGLPVQAQITLNTKPIGFVYDLTTHHQIPTINIRGKVEFGVDLGAGEGKLFLVTDKPVGKLQVSAPSSVSRGARIPVKVLLPDNAGNILQAVVPLKITIRDANGQIAEESGYYGAAHGQLDLNLDIAPNDSIGKWQVEVTESLTGQKQIAYFSVMK